MHIENKVWLLGKGSLQLIIMITFITIMTEEDMARNMNSV